VSRKGKLLGLILSAGILAVICTGCTHPNYTRTVVRHYDANGKLTGSTVTDQINQTDPSARTLHPEIYDHFYKED
jgi:hypothetical protein